jgi:O-antigen/teichoic acid export membrane protein
MEFLALPLCFGGAATLPAIFAVWLDAHWHDGVIPAQILICTAAILGLNYCCAALLLARGRAGREAMVSTVQTVSSILLVLIAAPFGLVATVLAIGGGWFALLPVPLGLARKSGGPGLLTLAARLMPLLAAAAVMGLATLWVGTMLLPTLGPVATLAVQIPLGVVIYGLSARLLAADLMEKTMRQLGTLPLLGRLFIRPVS